MDTSGYLAELRRSGDLLAAAAEGHLDRPVPDCPDWRVVDLVVHTGDVFARWTDVAATGDRPVPGQSQHPDGVPADEAVPWYRATLDALVDALAALDPAAERWNWSGADQTGGWIQRRMALEAAVHGWDAQAARVSGAGADPDRLPEPIPVAVALDGIDEYLWVFERAWSHKLPLEPATIHLHVTDLGAGADREGEWLITSEGHAEGDAPKVSVTRGHAKGDLAVRGSAADLFLFLWGRDRRDALELFGDESLAAAISGGV